MSTLVFHQHKSPIDRSPTNEQFRPNHPHAMMKIMTRKEHAGSEEDRKETAVTSGEELSTLAQHLATLALGTIDWSDSWSDADLREFTAASLRRI